MTETKPVETIALGDDVLIKPLGFVGNVWGLAFYTYHLPQVLVEFVNARRELVREWFFVSQLTKTTAAAERKNNITPIRG